MIGKLRVLRGLASNPRAKSGAMRVRAISLSSSAQSACRLTGMRGGARQAAGAHRPGRRAPRRAPSRGSDRGRQCPPRRRQLVVRAAGGKHDALEAEPGRLLEPPVGVRDVAQLPGQPDLAEAARGGPPRRRAARSRAAEATRARPRGRPPAPRCARRRRRSRTRRPTPATGPPWRASTARIMLSRLRSMPFATRRGGTTSVGATSAWTSTSSGRVPSIAHSTQEPGTGSASRRKRSDGSATSVEPARAHLEDADLVRRAEAVLERAQRAEAALALALELEHAVDRVLEHARAGERALLGHVADQDHRAAPLAREALERRRDLLHLADAARARRSGRTTTGSGPSRSRRPAGRSCSSDASTTSSEVSASTGTASACGPRRSARSLTWAADSSPLT